MADDILGENLYPPRDELPKSSLRRSNNPTRKHSYQSSLDTDRFSDRSSPESRTGMNLTSGFASLFSWGGTSGLFVYFWS